MYTELITELGLSTGKMNYHIEQLGGLIEKNEENRYEQTPKGPSEVVSTFTSLFTSFNFLSSFMKVKTSSGEASISILFVNFPKQSPPSDYKTITNLLFLA